MKKIFSLLLTFVLFLICSGLAPKVSADGELSCGTALRPNLSVSGLPTSIYTGLTDSFTLDFSNLPAESTFNVQCRTHECGWFGGWCNWDKDVSSLGSITSNQEGTARVFINNASQCFSEPDRRHQISLSYNLANGSTSYCKVREFDVENDADEVHECLGQSIVINNGSDQAGCIEHGDTIDFEFQIGANGNPLPNATIMVGGIPENSLENHHPDYSTIAITDGSGFIRGRFLVSDQYSVGNNIRITTRKGNISRNQDVCIISVSNPIRETGFCTEDERDQEPVIGNTDFSTNPFSLCDQLAEGSDEKDACTTCLTNTNNQGIWTAVGCIDGEPGSLIKSIVSLGVKIGGGVALIMILVAGFMFTTSQGEPKRVTDAKELMQSAVIGLLFVIFSVTILQFIGVNILQIPGFGGS